MKRVIEIRAAEGGEDSRLFVQDLAQAYIRLAQRMGWLVVLVEHRPGQSCITLEGQNLNSLDNESGGHRIQRIPPTERKGRVHTSTVTVAVIDPNLPKYQIKSHDLKIEWYSGTGAGGQYRNKHQNSCRITHIPSSMVATAQCRSRENSLAQAQSALEEKVLSFYQQRSLNEQAQDRKQQVGSGQRGDKIRTYRFQDDITQDHRSGRRAQTSAVMRGYFEKLWR